MTTPEPRIIDKTVVHASGGEPRAHRDELALLLPAAEPSWGTLFGRGHDGQRLLWSVQHNLDGPVCPHDHHSIRLDPFDLSASQFVPGPVAQDLLRGEILKVRKAGVAADHDAIERQRWRRWQRRGDRFRACRLGTIRMEKGPGRDHLVDRAGARIRHNVVTGKGSDRERPGDARW